MALDHGAVRTGVADLATRPATLARPLTVVERVDTDAGFAAPARADRAEAPGARRRGLARVARRARARAGARGRGPSRARLAAAVDVPVELYDERFTTKLADQRGGTAARDARAAAALLEDYLRTVR